jgi:aminopeptidase
LDDGTTGDVDRLERYAELAVRVGANVQAGQTLFLTGHLGHAPLIERIAREAYRAGAAYVDVRYNDDRIRRAMVELGPEAALAYTPPWLKLWAESHDGQARIWISGDPDPEALDGLDGERLGRARMHDLMEILTRHVMTRGTVNWSTVAYPNPGWATAMFGEPDVERLWEAVAFSTRLDEDDPVTAWRDHLRSLERRAGRLNELAFKTLRYRGSRTDLTIGLAANARWLSALSRTASGIEYLPNIPTEEVYTTPDCRIADGTVHSPKPLRVNGQLVEGLELTVRGGRIVSADADRGADVVRATLRSDERAAYFGEVALVDRSSRVAQLDTMFHDILYDENAGSHIAFGAGLPQAFDGDPGEALNVSTVHVDFIVGSPDLEVDGQLPDGGWIPVMHGDEWQIE